METVAKCRQEEIEVWLRWQDLYRLMKLINVEKSDFCVTWLWWEWVLLRWLVSTYRFLPTWFHLEKVGLHLINSWQWELNWMKWNISPRFPALSVGALFYATEILKIRSHSFLQCFRYYKDTFFVFENLMWLIID